MSACFRLAAIWMGGGDIKARVGWCCKVKLPRRGSSAAAREEGGSERQDGGIAGVFIHQHPPGGEGGGRGARTIGLA